MDIINIILGFTAGFVVSFIVFILPLLIIAYLHKRRISKQMLDLTMMNLKRYYAKEYKKNRLRQRHSK